MTLRKAQALPLSLLVLSLPLVMHIEGTVGGGALYAIAASPDDKSAVKTALYQLQDMGKSIHHLKRAAADLVAECQREMGFYGGGEIDFIGTDIIPIMPTTAEGFGPPQYLPPRPKYVTYHVNEIANLVPILQEEWTNVPALTAQQKDEEMPDLNQARTYLSSMQDHLLKLQKATASGGPYDSAVLVTEATAIHDAVSKIDKLRKDVYSIIKD